MSSLKKICQPFAKVLATLGLFCLGLFPLLTADAATPAISDSATQNELVKTDGPFVRVTELAIRAVPPGTPNTAAYFTIENLTDKTVVLQGGTVPIAAKVELHDTEYHAGRARMVQQKSITIGPKQTVLFKPGGLHMMIMNIKQTPMSGDKFPITLHFNDDRQAIVQGVVRARISHDMKNSQTSYHH